MRISDWSSDVCSSDLRNRRERLHRIEQRAGRAGADRPRRDRRRRQRGDPRRRRWRTAPRPRRAARQARLGRPLPRCNAQEEGDRKSVVEGKSWSVRVERGGGRIIKKKKNTQTK